MTLGGNNVIPNVHFRKVNGMMSGRNNRVMMRTWFDQAGRKKRRALNRQKKAALLAPRPAAGLLRPVVHPPTQRYNMKLRLGKGFTMEELTEKFQESTAQALERRLNIECCATDVEERPDCQGDLVGRMTPPKTQQGCMTPPEEVLTHPGPDEQTVAEKLEKVQHRARRSSAIKRKSIQEAVSKAASRHRRSLLTKVFEKTEEGTLASPESNATIDLAVQTAQKRHRLSILKAAETLDAASLDNEDDATVSKKFQMVHKAMEEARTRHRRSIASAVQNITAVIAEQPSKQVSGMSAEAMPFHPEHCIQQRIQSAIASAHRRHQQKKQQIFKLH